MKCKPNDLVMFIRPMRIYQPHTGEPAVAVRCGAMATVSHLDSSAAWVLKEPIPLHVQWSCGSWATGELIAVDDAFLMPIGRPGAEDKTLTQRELEAV